MVPVVYRACKPYVLCKTCFYCTSNFGYLQFVNFALNVALVWNWVSALRTVLIVFNMVIYLLIDVLIKIDLEVLRLCGDR